MSRSRDQVGLTNGTEGGSQRRSESLFADKNWGWELGAAHFWTNDHDGLGGLAKPTRFARSLGTKPNQAWRQMPRAHA